jgi:hypothetical protein
MSLLQAYEEEYERKETTVIDVSNDQRRHSMPPLQGRYDQSTTTFYAASSWTL